MTPYWDCNFFTFFSLLLKRGFACLIGHCPPLAADEVQLAVLIAVAISCGILSPFLILKRLTMLANSLSHTILLGISLAALSAKYLWGGQWFDVSTLLIGALFAAFLTAFCTHALTKWFRLQKDASIGLVFSGLFALGITLITLYLKDVHLGVEAVMGNADALQLSDLTFPTFFIVLNGLFILLFFKQFQLMSFDKHLAKTFGTPTALLQSLFLFLIAATSIGAFRAVGVILVLAFLTGPYLTARLFCSRLERLLIWTPLIGAASSLIGVALSRHLLNIHGLALSTGGLVTTTIGLLYIAARLFLHMRKKIGTLSQALPKD